MKIPVTHPSFQRQSLSVETGGLFSSARLLIDGVPMKRTKEQYLLVDDSGRPATAELKSRILDPIPQLKRENEAIALAPKLQWYEYT